MRLLIIIALFLFFQSCSQEPKIVITKDYISNNHWDDERNNAIHVEKMKVKKGGVLNANSPDFDKEIRSDWDLNDKLEVDSTFYFGYSGLNIKKDKVKLHGKVFFNKDNGFEWYSAKGNKTIIGSLKNNTWYKFSELKTKPYFIYVYVDSIGNTHSFAQDLSNR